MKKKLIENLPAPRITKNMEGVVVIARNPAAGLLTLDVVETVTKEVEVRICVTEKEFANYYPETGAWDGKQIDGIMTFVTMGEGKIIHYDLYGKTNIQKVLGKKYESILSVQAYEYYIAQEKRMDAERSRARACKRRNDAVPEPDENMKMWLERYVGLTHYIYYKRKGKYAQIACSACGHSGRYVMIPETDEDIFRKHLDFKPEHNMGGKPCPACGAYGIWKAAGRTRGVWCTKDRRYIVDKVDGNIVVRYFEIEKHIQGTEWGTSENTICMEIARNWFIDSRLQKDYFKYDPFTGKDFWDDRNLAGMANIQQKSGKVRLKEERILEGTSFQYSGLGQEIRNNDYTDAVRYLSVYMRYQMIELLQKLGMTKLKCDILESYGEVEWLKREGRKPQDIFMITKQRFNDLREKNGGKRLLGIYQYEFENNIRFKDEMVEKLCIFRVGRSEITVIRRHGKLEKAINYVMKQKGINPDYMGCGEKEEVRSGLEEYKDYLVLLEQNGRQFTEHELYPADLAEAHHREVTLRNKNKQGREIEEKNKKNPQIKKDAARYNRRYRYQNKDYVIRAPKDAGEIFMEGLTLNHCVGRMGYIEAMNRHETVILLLRKKTHKDIPYYTLEIKDGELTQAYGYGDKKPDWEKISSFLEAFKEAKLKDAKGERKAG